MATLIEQNDKKLEIKNKEEAGFHVKNMEKATNKNNWPSYEKYKKVENSMTPKEKNDPDLIDASRTKRIARGSGTTEPEVKEFLNNYYKLCYHKKLGC